MHATASHDAIQSSRSELKFEMDEERAVAIREFMRVHLRPDPNAGNGPYPVCSVYLDSPDGKLFEQTNQGVRNRHKLRVRIYDNDDRHPAFLEIKGREGGAIKKQRSRVDRDLARAVLSGESVSFSQSRLPSPTHADWLAFEEFCRLRDRIHATGCTYVCYQREAFVAPGHNYWRATFDRSLQASTYEPGVALRMPDTWIPASDKGHVVFELKFTDQFPRWMDELVKVFDLTAGPFPKYVTCRNTVRRSSEHAESIMESTRATPAPQQNAEEANAVERF